MGKNIEMPYADWTAEIYNAVQEGDFRTQAEVAEVAASLAVELLVEKHTQAQPAKEEAAKVVLTPGQQVYFLSQWNQVNKKACSEAFTARMDGRNKDPFPVLSKAPGKDAQARQRAEINNDPDLLLLNGIRQGVKKAMVSQQKAVEEARSSQSREEMLAGLPRLGVY